MVLFNRCRYHLPGFLDVIPGPLYGFHRSTDYFIHSFRSESTSPSLVGYSISG